MLRSKHEMNNDLAGFMAQYQQDPIKREGTVFNSNDMKYYKELPKKKPIKIIQFKQFTTSSSSSPPPSTLL